MSVFKSFTQCITFRNFRFGQPSHFDLLALSILAFLELLCVHHIDTLQILHIVVLMKTTILHVVVFGDAFAANADFWSFIAGDNDHHNSDDANPVHYQVGWKLAQPQCLIMIMFISISTQWWCICLSGPSCWFFCFCCRCN